MSIVHLSPFSFLYTSVSPADVGSGGTEGGGGDGGGALGGGGAGGGGLGDGLGGGGDGGGDGGGRDGGLGGGGGLGGDGSGAMFGGNGIWLPQRWGTGLILHLGASRDPAANTMFRAAQPSPVVNSA